MCFLFPFGLFLRVVPALRDEVTIWVWCVGLARPTVVVGAAPFLLMVGFEPLSEASLAEAESRRLSLALSSVLPCPMLWLHVRLHDTCSRSKVVLGALP